jgi:predicted RNA methylase
VSRLSKAQVKAHEEAVRRLDQERLSDDDREFVLENWQESANHINSAAGAFFTPSGLARDTALFSSGAETVVDLCAGIGGLGLWAWWTSQRRAQVTCVEVNPDYVAVGQKLFPEARWICASVDQLPPDIGTFDCALANPPFGKVAKIGGPRYSGEDDLAVVDIAADLARWGVFILPTMSCPFRFSGEPGYRGKGLGVHTDKADRFEKATGLRLQCESIDASYYANDWRGVSPKVEVCGVDFEGWRAERESAEMPLFGAAA